MASKDPLTMSLDDIIKMKRQKRRGGGGGGSGRKGGSNNNHQNQNQRGRDKGSKTRGGRGSSNTGGNAQQYLSFGRGREGGQSARGRGRIGRGRGLGGTAGQGKLFQALTSRLGTKGISRSGNPSILQGNRLGRGNRGRSIVTARGGDTGPEEVRRGRDNNLIQRMRKRDQYNDNFQVRDMLSMSGLQTVRNKLQKRQRSISGIQQMNRSAARSDVINQRRGLVSGVKTSGNLGAPLRVRVGNGTIVRGLRSDQLLLQKIRQSKKSVGHGKLDKLEAMRDRRDRLQNGRDSSMESDSIVSLSSHRGLTVSIKNNMVSKSLHNGTSSRSRSRLSWHKSKKLVDDMFAPATFTVVNDHVANYDSDFEMVQDSPRKISKRNVITTREPRIRTTSASMSVGTDNARSLPEPHRQILDPKIQKEIAMLQGKDEVTLNSGPGPGVKGFRHVPSQTTRSLNERFTNERLVTV